MVSLRNLHDFLKSSCPYNLSFEEPTSYLQTIALAQNNCIFICEKEKDLMPIEKTPYNNYSTNIKPNFENLNLTGSPLKDDCNISDLKLSLDDLCGVNDERWWKNGEEHLKPIKLDKARSLLCDMKLQKKAKETNSCGYVWILCDASDCEKTILLNLKFMKDFNSSGIIKFNGLMPPSNLNSGTLMELHNSLINHAIKTETILDSYYNITPNMTLRLNWSTSSRKFDLYYAKNADVTLYQTITINNPASVCDGYWNQLVILNLIKDDIVNYKFNNKSEIEYKRGTGIGMDLLRERIDSCMTEISSASFLSDDNSESIEKVIMKLKARPPNDLTDKLWDIIKSCSSYRDLKTAFNYIFQQAALRDIINMPMNDNCLAEIIRGISHRRLAIPCLSGTEPLELLLEIGLEKLHKDYEFIFLKSKISTANSLQLIENRNLSNNSNLKVRNTLYNAAKPDKLNTERKTLLHSNKEKTNDEIIGFQNSIFNRQDIEIKLNKLSKIHVTLEHLVSMQNSLDLGNAYSQICAQLLNRKMCSLEELIEVHLDKIEVPLSIDKIISLIENKIPHSRRISIKSGNKFRETESIYYFNMENIFPPNTFTELKTEDKEVSTQNMYFCWTYIQNSTR